MPAQARDEGYTGDGYFYARAEAELRLAQAAGHPAAVRAHYLLAGYYLDRYYSDGLERHGRQIGSIIAGQTT